MNAGMLSPNSRKVRCVRTWGSLGIVSLAWGMAACDRSAPSDASLVGLFEKNRSVFERLRGESCAIAPQTVWDDVNGAEPKLSTGKYLAFQALMAKVDASRIASVSLKNGRPKLPCSAEITVWSTGFLDSGDDRSFVYAPRPDNDDLVVPDLQGVNIASTVHRFPKPSSHGHRRYMKHIVGSWWLVRDYWE